MVWAGISCVSLQPLQSNFPALQKLFRQLRRGFGESFCGVFLTHCILSW